MKFILYTSSSWIVLCPTFSLSIGFLKTLRGIVDYEGYKSVDSTIRVPYLDLNFIMSVEWNKESILSSP
jgi:hypothetical protein